MIREDEEYTFFDSVAATSQTCEALRMANYVKVSEFDGKDLVGDMSVLLS